MANPFSTEFVKGMEAILSLCPTPESILCRMQTIDKDEDPVLYHSLDCALCYIVYETFKDVSEMSPEVDKVIARVNENIVKMQVTG